MKGLISGAFALLIMIILVTGAIAICGWFISILLNVVLGQIGLGKINTWGGCCILATAQIIKGFINW